MSSRRRIADARRHRSTIGNEFGRLIVKRTRRAVRVTAITTTDAMTGAPCAASFAFADLDEAGVDRLIRRLTAIRGGRKALRRCR